MGSTVWEAAAPLLRCPIEGGALHVDVAALGCAGGHRFDLARQGYVSLLPGSGGRHHGDDAAMVARRVELAALGLWGPLTAALRDVTEPLPASEPAVVVDVGSGPGHHLAGVLTGRSAALGVAIDASKAAARRAARADDRIAAVVADAWAGLPLRDRTADVLLNVFAPRNGPEFARVLRPGGRAIVVTPAPDHLAALVDGLDLLTVDPRKHDRVDQQLAPALVRRDESALRWPLQLTHATVRDLVGSGPSRWHLSPEELDDRLGRLPSPVVTEASVGITTFVAATTPLGPTGPAPG